MRLDRRVTVLLMSAVLVLGGAVRLWAQPHSEPGAGEKKDEHSKKDEQGKADQGGHEQAKSDGHGEGEGHKKHGPFDFAFEEGIWTLLVFIILLIVLRKYAWGPMLEGLRKREEHIRLAVEEAKMARQETERVRLDFKSQMDKAYAEIPKIMEEARRDAAALREEMKSKAASEIQADRDRLRREIETARDQALQELWNQTTTLATLISAKAIGRSLTAEDHRRLADEALSEVQSAGGEWKSELRQFGDEWSRKGGSQE